MTIEASGRDRVWAVAAHLTTYLGLLVYTSLLIGPAVVWWLKRKGHPLIREQAKAVINFQLSMLLFGGLGALVIQPMPSVGKPVALFFLGMALIQPLLAAVQTARGKRFNYLFSIRFFG